MQVTCHWQGWEEGDAAERKVPNYFRTAVALKQSLMEHLCLAGSVEWKKVLQGTDVSGRKPCPWLRTDRQTKSCAGNKKWGFEGWKRRDEKLEIISIKYQSLEIIRLLKKTTRCLWFIIPTFFVWILINSFIKSLISIPTKNVEIDYKQSIW